MYCRFLNVSDRMLDAAGEAVHRDGLCVLGCLYRLFGCLHDARSLESGYLDDLAAEPFPELVDAYNVTALFHYIHHVDRDNDRDAKLGELCG